MKREALHKQINLLPNCIIKPRPDNRRGLLVDGNCRPPTIMSNVFRESIWKRVFHIGQHAAERFDIFNKLKALFGINDNLCHFLPQRLSSEAANRKIKRVLKHHRSTTNGNEAELFRDFLINFTSKIKTRIRTNQRNPYFGADLIFNRGSIRLIFNIKTFLFQA